MSNVQIVHREDDREPWERRVRETTKAYAYFTTYRDMGPIDRSYRAVATKTKKSLTYITKLAIKNEWSSRVEAWDGYQEQRKRRVQQETIDEMNDRQARIAMTMFSKIAQRLVGDEANSIVALDPNTLSAKDIAALSTVATKMERMARGVEVEQGGDAVKVRVAFEISPVFPGAALTAQQAIEPPLVEPSDVMEGEYEEVT